MIELNSNELDWTTNLRQIYHRLSDPLQTRRRKVAKSYHERNNRKEPTLMGLSRFTSAESLTESDPVFGKCSLPTAKFGNPKKVFLNTKQVSAPRIATLATDIMTEEGVIGKGSVKSQSSRKISSSETSHCQAEICKVCKGNHGILKCPVFPSKSLNWRRQFARTRGLCLTCKKKMSRQEWLHWERLCASSHPSFITSHTYRHSAWTQWKWKECWSECHLINWVTCKQFNYGWYKADISAAEGSACVYCC